MNLNSHKLTLTAVAYCYAGVILFLVSWIRWYWALPAAALLILCFADYWKSLGAGEPAEKLPINVPCLLVVAAILLLCTAAGGSGAFFEQTSDWTKHNAMLNDLVRYRWPVVYRNPGEHALLSYYVADYLIPAAVGKLAGSFHAAELAQLVWNFLGLMLTVLLLFRVAGAKTTGKQAATLLIFLIFGSVLTFGQLLYGATDFGSRDAVESIHWISESIPIQYPGNWMHFRWAFPQAILPWIVTALFAENTKNPRYYVFLAAPLLLQASFAFVCMAVLMAGVFIADMITSRDVPGRLRAAISAPNICALAGGLLIPLIYLSGNVLAGDKPSEVGLVLIRYGSNIVLYVCFCVTFLCYSAVIFWEYRKCFLFYLVNVILLALPFVRGGMWNDLCMRASVPATYLLMIFIIRALFTYVQRRKWAPVVLLAVLLAFGSRYQILDLPQSFSLDGSARQPVISLADFAHRDGSVRVDEAYNYFTYDYETSAFYRLFARR